MTTTIPREPSIAMLVAGVLALRASAGDDDDYRAQAIYQAMYDAARAELESDAKPATVAPQGEDSTERGT